MNEFIAKGDILVPKDVAIQDLSGGVWSKYTLDVIDHNGKLIDRKEGPSRSFMRNFGRFFYQIFNVNSDINIQFDDDGGVGRYFAIIDAAGGVNANEGPIAAAAVMKVGTSSAAVNSSHDDIQGPIVGMGVSGAVSDVTVVEDGTSSSWYHEVTITNTTGISQTIREMALYARLRRGDLIGQTDRCMMLRDVVADTVVPNGSSVIPRYTFTVAV